jgi:hypothetical protein
MKVGTNGSIENHWNSDAKGANSHDGYGITPGKANLNNRAGSLPSTHVDQISSPALSIGKKKLAEFSWANGGVMRKKIYYATQVHIDHV